MSTKVSDEQRRDRDNVVFHRSDSLIFLSPILFDTIKSIFVLRATFYNDISSKYRQGKMFLSRGKHESFSLKLIRTRSRDPVTGTNNYIRNNKNPLIRKFENERE